MGKARGAAKKTLPGTARPLDETTGTIAPQNNYGDSEDDGQRPATAAAAPTTHPTIQRRSSTPFMQSEGQNLKPGGSSAASVPVVLQQQFDDDDDDEEEEEKHEREETMQEAYFDDLNDADEYKTYDEEEMEDDEDEYDDEYAARRSQRIRRRSRDGDRNRHGSYDAQQEDESYSDCGDDDQEQNLMDLLNNGVSKSGSEADVTFHDSSNLDASIAVHNLASALPPPPPPPSSSQQGQPKQPGAASDPVADSANAFGVSSRWSQFEDDDQLQQMTLEANTAAVMMQMEKHMAKKEAGGGGHHSRGDQGQIMGWMDKARSVVAKIDEVTEREHLAAAAEEQQDERGEFQRRTSLKLGDDDTEESPKYRTAEGGTYYDVGDVPVGHEGGDSSSDLDASRQQIMHQQQCYGNIRDVDGSREPLRRSKHEVSARRRSRSTPVPSDDTRRPSSQQLDNKYDAARELDDPTALGEGDEYNTEYLMPLNDAHDMETDTSTMEWQIDNPSGLTSYRHLPRPPSESPSLTQEEGRSETPSSEEERMQISTSGLSAESSSSFSSKNYVVNWTRTDQQSESEGPRVSALGQLDQSVDRSAEGAHPTELAPTALGKRIYEAESDASSSIKSDESSALDRYPNYLQNQDSTVSDYSYLYPNKKAEFDKPNTDEGAVEIKASTKPLLVYNATEEEPKRLLVDARRDELLRGLLTDTAEEMTKESVAESPDNSQQSLFKQNDSSGKGEGESPTTSLKSLSTKKEMLLQNLLAPANADSEQDETADDDAVDSIVSHSSVESEGNEHRQEEVALLVPAMDNPVTGTNNEDSSGEDDDSIGQARDTESSNLLDRKVDYLSPPPSPSVILEAPSSSPESGTQPEIRMKEGNLLDRRADFLIPPPTPSVLSADQDSQSQLSAPMDIPARTGNLLQRKAAYLVPPAPPSELSVDQQSEAPSMAGSVRSAVRTSASNLLDRKARYLVPPPPPSEFSVDQHSEVVSAASVDIYPTVAKSSGLLERKAKYLAPPPPASVLSIGEFEYETQPTSLMGSDSLQSASIKGGLLERKDHFLESIPPASEVSQTVREEDLAAGSVPSKQSKSSEMGRRAADEESIGRRDSFDDKDDVCLLPASASASPAVVPLILKRKDALLAPVDIEQSEMSATSSSRDEDEAGDRFDAVQSYDPAALRKFSTGGVQPRSSLKKEGSWSRREIQQRSDHELSSNSDITHSHHSDASAASSTTGSRSPPRGKIDEKETDNESEKSPSSVAASGLTDEYNASASSVNVKKEDNDEDHSDGFLEWPEHNERMLARPVKTKAEVDPIEKDWVILCLAPTGDSDNVPINDDETSYASSSPMSADDPNIMTLYPSDIAKAELGARREHEESDITESVAFHKSLNIDSDESERSWRHPVPNDTSTSVEKGTYATDDDEDKRDGVVDTFGWFSRHLLSDDNKADGSILSEDSSRMQKEISYESDNNSSSPDRTEKAVAVESIDVGVPCEEKSIASKAASIESERSSYQSDNEYQNARKAALAATAAAGAAAGVAAGITAASAAPTPDIIPTDTYEKALPGDDENISGEDAAEEAFVDFKSDEFKKAARALPHFDRLGDSSSDSSSYDSDSTEEEEGKEKMQATSSVGLADEYPYEALASSKPQDGGDVVDDGNDDDDQAWAESLRSLVSGPSYQGGGRNEHSRSGSVSFSSHQAPTSARKLDEDRSRAESSMGDLYDQYDSDEDSDGESIPLEELAPLVMGATHPQEEEAHQYDSSDESSRSRGSDAAFHRGRAAATAATAATAAATAATVVSTAPEEEGPNAEEIFEDCLSKELDEEEVIDPRYDTRYDSDSVASSAASFNYQTSRQAEALGGPKIQDPPHYSDDDDDDDDDNFFVDEELGLMESTIKQRQQRDDEDENDDVFAKYAYKHQDSEGQLHDDFDDNNSDFAPSPTSPTKKKSKAPDFSTLDWKTIALVTLVIAVVAAVAGTTGSMLPASSTNAIMKERTELEDSPATPPTNDTGNVKDSADEILSPTSAPTASFLESRAYLQLGSPLMGEGENDLAGFAVSLSADGRYAAMGARRNAEDGKKNRGSVRIFKFNGNEFVMVVEIDGGRKGDQFGYSCSLSGDGKKIAIGAPGADAGGKNSGEVLIYEERFGEWIQTGTLSGEEKQDLFGLSVSLDAQGETLAIGAPYDSVGDSAYAGAVYVYGAEADGTWYSLGPRMEGVATRQLFGWSVSISSSTSSSLRVAIGSPHDETRTQSHGLVGVYEYDPMFDAWEVVGKEIKRETELDRFGFSVSLSADGRRVAVGAIGDNSNGPFSGIGCVYDYSNSKGAWSEIGCESGNEGEKLGIAISLSPDSTQLQIGRPKRRDKSGKITGQINTYHVMPSSLRPLGDINGERGDNIGFSLSSSTDARTILSGSPASGRARVFFAENDLEAGPTE